MIIPIELRFKADKDSKSAFRTDKTIKSHDVNSIEFHITIEGLELTDSHTAKILSVFHQSKSQVNADCEIVEGKIIYKPDTNLISRHEHVTNYVYVYNGHQSLDVCEFLYVVDLSKIDETSLEVKEVYDQSYVNLLADFEQALNDYKDNLPQADSVRAEIDVVLNQFGVDSQAKLSQYDADAQQAIADNQTAFDLAESGRQDNYEQAETARNQASNQAVADWEQGADALLETVEGNESERVDGEASRVEKESERVQAESSRIQAELDRQAQEEAREKAEGVREEAESARELNEQNRLSKDLLRDDKIAKMEADKDAVIASATVDSEVILARGGKATLGQRLDETTAQLAQKANQLTLKADKTYVDAAKDRLNARIDNVISTPTEISEQEIIDSRYDVIDGVLYKSLGERLNQYKSEYVEKNLSEEMLLLELPNGVKDEIITDSDGNLTAIITNVKSDIVLNGSENWRLYGSGETEFISFRISKPQNMANSWELNTPQMGAITATDFTSVGYLTYDHMAEGIASSNSSLTICIKRDKLSTEDVNGFKLWLANNEQRVTYQLETPTLTKIPENLSANARSILGSAFEIQELNLIKDKRLTFKTLGNGVSDEVVKGAIIRKVGYKVIRGSDIRKIQLGSRYYVEILSERFYDYKYDGKRVSERERGSAILEGHENIYDQYLQSGRKVIFSFLVDEERTVESIKDELVGLRLFYELRDEEHISVSHNINKSILDLFNKIKLNDTQININSDAIEAIKDVDVPPEYVKQEIKKIADIIYDEASYDTFVFAALTDFHTTGADVSAIGVSHAFSAVKEMQQHINLSMVALLGDYVRTYFDNDNAIAKNSLRYVRQQSLKIQNCKTIFLQGNHDTARDGSSEEDRDKYYNYIGRNNDTKIDYENKFRNYGYVDYEKNKIRVIYLNTADVTNGESGTFGVSSDQLDWFINEALFFDEKKAGWGSVVMCHHPLNWSGMDNVLKIMGAFKGKKTGEVNIDGKVLTYNFESTEGEFIANFHGHIHNFRAEFLTEPQHNEDVLTITIPNACYDRNNEYGTLYGTEIAEKFGDPDSKGNQRVFPKTSGTVEDTSFNFVLIDRVNRKIKCLNYGAGIDREFDY